MKVFFSGRAERHMEDAYDFYEGERAGLGDEFAIELEHGVYEIAAAPMRWPEDEPGFRRFRLRRFPYLLFYRITASGVEIVAVWHTARMPGGWR